MDRCIINISVGTFKKSVSLVCVGADAFVRRTSEASVLPHYPVAEVSIET